MNAQEKLNHLILVVEDDGVLNTLMRRVLQRDGYKTEGFTCGADAMLRLGTGLENALLLLDYSLPDMNAREFIATTTELRIFTPFVIVTGHGDEQLAVEMMKLGARDYITKTGNINDLLTAKIERVFEEINRDEALRRSEEQYRLISENTDDVIWIMDLKTERFTFVSPSVERLRGFTPEEVMAQPVSESMVPRSREAVFAGLDPRLAAFVGGDATARTNTSLVDQPCKDGSIVSTEVVTSILTDGSDRPIQILGITRNITERKRVQKEKEQLEEQLRQSQKLEAIGQLAGGVAHDFNNILGGIMGYAEVLKMHLADNPALLRYPEKIINSSAKAAELTRQLLLFARKVRVNIATVDIHDCIREVATILKHTVDKRIEIELDLQASPTTIAADANQIENAMLNIAINARDAMPQGGTLKFSSKTLEFSENNRPAQLPALVPGRYVEIKIRDTGTGMHAATMQRIFEPFFTTKDPGKGTGLGLAAVYGCVRQHNGHILVESEIGRGSTFRILLPSTNKITASTENNDRGMIKGRGSIMIVDDEEAMCEITGDILKSLGYTSVAFKEPTAAITHYRANFAAIDAVLLDLIMPKMSGLDCFRELKSINPAIKVVVASGYSDENQENQIAAEGVTTFLAKPFKAIDLSRALAKALGSEKPAIGAANG